MKARTVVLSLIFTFLFAVSASAQRYHRPYYTQQWLPEPYTASVFLENRTDGHLRVKLEVNGQTLLVEVTEGHEVPDLKLPVGSRVKLKEAKALVFEGKKTVERNAKFYKYTRGDGETGEVQSGWLFYLDKSFKP